MPLYDYDCQNCRSHFEQILRTPDDPEGGVCPDCGTAGAIRRVSRFRVGGRGDLRETTSFHGCHSALDVNHEHSHDHSHDHSHGGGGGHVHGPGCGHSSSGTDSSKKPEAKPLTGGSE